MELQKQERMLPARLEDLAQFVLVGRDKLAMVRAGIRALDKLDVAEGVRQQKKEEAQMLADALLDAETKIGEIMLAMPKTIGQHEVRGNQYKSGKLLSSEEFSTQPASNSKQQITQQLGFNRMQVERFQTLAQNKDLVEQVKAEARENDDLPTRTAVLQLAKARKREEQIQIKGSTEIVPDEDAKLIEAMKRGETIVLNMNTNFHALKYAKDNNLYQQIDRWTDWGNPYNLPSDGDRNEVCDAFEIYLKYKKSLLTKIHELKGKALGCHCYPNRCHGDHLKQLADEKGN